MTQPSCKMHAVLAAEMDIQGRVTGAVAAVSDAVQGTAAGVQRTLVRQLMVRTPWRLDAVTCPASHLVKCGNTYSILTIISVLPCGARIEMSSE